VFAALDRTGAAGRGSVTIANGIFSVRPYRRRRVFELPLADVATMVCRRIVVAERIEKRRNRKRGRRG
jgi:hypothetical protein